MRLCFENERFFMGFFKHPKKRESDFPVLTATTRSNHLAML